MAYIPRIGSFKRTCHFCRIRRCRAKPLKNYHIIFRASFLSSNSPLREAKMPSLMLRRKLRLCLDSKRHCRSLKRCDLNTVHQILWTVAFGYIALVPQQGKRSPTQRVQDVQLMIRRQSPSSKATNVFYPLNLCFFASDSQENSRNSDL